MASEVYNANWLASNLVRKYPLDSLSSCIDKHGNYLPDEIITDIQVTYPSSLGEYCYVAAVKLTEKIISILIAVDLTPIAALCVSYDEYLARRGLYFSMEPLYDGVHAIITLGCDKTSKKGFWEFDNAEDSRILPTCCTPYVLPNVLSISRPSDSDPLTGNILLTSGGDIKLDVAELLIEGKKKRVILVGLDMSVDPHSILKKYITPCEVSTSMNSCALPYLESIGGAIPDCSGNVNIVVGDSGHMNITTEDGMVILNTDIKLKDVCGDNDSDKSDSSSSSSTDCPYPSVVSDDICTDGIHTTDIDYDFEGTDVDLYSNDVVISPYSRSGLVYGSDPSKPSSITSSDEGVPVDFDVRIKPDTKTAVAFSFTDLTSSGKPKGSIHINIGNDNILIDQGQISVICDVGLGDDRKYFGDDLLNNTLEAKIIYTDDQLVLSTDNGSTILAELDDGLSGFSSNGYNLHIQMNDNVYLDGVRYD